MSTQATAPSATRAICVYCGSASGMDPVYVAAARLLGARIAASGYGLVYGAGGVGLMGEVARAVLAGGGHVLGIIPAFLRDKEVHLKEVSELVVTQDMHQRKMLMFERADAFVAMPGGIGTLEELIEQMTWAQLGRHGKPIIIADIAGFWQPLLKLLGHMEEQLFLRKPFIESTARPLYEVVSDATQIVPRIETLLACASPPPGQDEIAGRF
jgi:uncharacterized protein (TIGR00730 family)